MTKIVDVTEKGYGDAKVLLVTNDKTEEVGYTPPPIAKGSEHENASNKDGTGKNKDENSDPSGGDATPSVSGSFSKSFDMDISKFKGPANGSSNSGNSDGQAEGGEAMGNAKSGGKDSQQKASNNERTKQKIADLIKGLATNIDSEIKVKEASSNPDSEKGVEETTDKSLIELIETIQKIQNGENLFAEEDAREQAEREAREAKEKREQLNPKDLNEARQMLQQMMKEYEEKTAKAVEKIAREKAQEAQPVINKIQLPDREEITIDGITSSNYELTLKILNALGIVWLCGPAGSGKTKMAEQLSQALNLPFYAISCTAGISESWFIGRRDINGEYISPEFLNLYENGGVILLDEFDAADPNTGLIINAAIGNGYLTVPLRVNAPLARRHPKFYVVFATNTWGFGVDGQYTGREGMDASTRDRAVMAKVYLDYSYDIEVQFLDDCVRTVPKKAWIPKKLKNGLGTTLQQVRSNIKAHNLKRIMSTRAFEQAKILRNAGFSDEEIVGIYFTDWSDNERAKGIIDVLG